MNMRYHYVPLEKVAVGMVLAEDLLDKVGHILLPSGTSLTASMLKSIAHHDIHQLAVETEHLSDAEQEHELRKKLERLDHLCRKGPFEEPASILLDYVRKYRMGEGK